MKKYDVVIIGGGAAGLMCAIAAGQRGRRVVVLEGSNKIGKKILMSGGGRCNFTNLYCEPSRFISANPHFCISALKRYTQWDFITLVEKYAIPYHEKSAGQLFCDRSSKDIVTMLSAECSEAGVDILTHCDVQEVTRQQSYCVASNHGVFSAPSLVVATGGLSIPKMGATDFAFRLARQFGLNVLETRAGLVPFTFTGAMHEFTSGLAGVSLPASLTVCGTTFDEDMLFTHRGLSGPAVLQVSSYWQPGAELRVNLLPNNDPNIDLGKALVDAKRTQPKTRLRTLLAEQLPKALVISLQPVLWAAYAETGLAEIPDDELQRLAFVLQNWLLRPAATEGYRTAEVTLGGVDTGELSSQTLEARSHPGLYFIGEAVDVTGHLGGFNFQWAWASGHATGQVV